ncbi:MAG: hypothetical protein ISS49_08315, partial [Anaerolineae bacterium]|nr:hypothetical protein [Anaerolineae bacterium]
RLYRQGDVLLGGDVWLVDWPGVVKTEFPELRHTPAETRRMFARRGWRSVVGFQTRNPIHRAHEYIQKTALEIVDGLFLHPLVGGTEPVTANCLHASAPGVRSSAQVSLRSPPHPLPPKTTIHSLVAS